MFVTNWISTTKIQKISEITNFFRHYFLSRTEVKTLKGKFSISSFLIFQAFSSDFLFLEYCLHGYGEKMGVEQSHPSVLFTGRDHV